MYLALLDPGVFLIDDASWACEQTKTHFLDRVTSHITVMDELRIIKLAWCDELEERIWSSPHLPPWTQSRGWANALIQVLYTSISRHKQMVPICGSLASTSNPQLRCCCQTAKEIFLRLVTATHNDGKEKKFCVGKDNCNQNFEFTLPSGGGGLAFDTINDPVEWYKKIDVTAFFWPETRNDQSTWQKCIKLSAIKLGISPDSLPPHKFSHTFIESVLTASVPEKLAISVVRRLHLGQAAACRDSQLHDEDVEGKPGVRRFRVTHETRIQYKVSNGVLEFLEFFDVGHHDDGL